MKIDKVETSGLVALFIGVALLAFTFFSAYSFLVGKLTIITSADLIEVFGRALAPLIEACIRILYLGIMGWISSILTIRGVQLLKREKEAAPSVETLVATKKPQPEVKQEVKPEAKSEKKPEVKAQAKPEAKETKPKVEEIKPAEETKKAEGIEKPEETKPETGSEAPKVEETEKVEEPEKTDLKKTEEAAPYVS